MIRASLGLFHVYSLLQAYQTFLNLRLMSIDLEEEVFVLSTKLRFLVELL